MNGIEKEVKRASLFTLEREGKSARERLNEYSVREKSRPNVGMAKANQLLSREET